MICAMVRTNQVMAIVECETEAVYQEFARTSQMIDITGVYPQPEIGWLFDGLRLTRPDGSVGLDMRITPLALRSRFTVDELVTITAATASNPVVKVLLDNVSVAKYIDLNSTTAQTGIFALASFGLITMERAQAIVGTVPTKDELAIGGS